MREIHCRTKQTGRNLYLFAPVAFAMKVTALHLWSIFTPKSGANAKEREGRMHFGVAQRFAALIAGVKQTSLKLSAKASAGLPRSVRGYAGLQRGIASQCPGVCRFVARDCLAGSRGYGFVARDGLGTWGVRAMYRAPRVHLLSGSWRTSRRLCFVSERTVGSKRFAFGELAHIKALAFCVQAARVSNIRAVPRDCLAVSGGMQVCDKRLHDQVQRL